MPEFKLTGKVVLDAHTIVEAATLNEALLAARDRIVLVAYGSKPDGSRRVWLAVETDTLVAEDICEAPG